MENPTNDESKMSYRMTIIDLSLIANQPEKARDPVSEALCQGDYKRYTELTGWTPVIPVPLKWDDMQTCRRCVDSIELGYERQSDGWSYKATCQHCGCIHHIINGDTMGGGAEYAWFEYRTPPACLHVVPL